MSCVRKFLAKTVDDELMMTTKLSVAGSGFIDFDEFVAVMDEFMPVDDAEQMRQAFAVIDKDGSGKISADELRQVMRSIGETEFTDDDVDEIIREIDMDGDGEVDYEGALHAYQQTELVNCNSKQFQEAGLYLSDFHGGGSEFRLATSDYSGHGGCQIGTVE